MTVLRERSEHCDVLIVNGGLGPTSDDLSALVAATAKGEGLVLHEEWLAHMERFFSERGRVMAPATANRLKSRPAPNWSITRWVLPAVSPFN